MSALGHLGGISEQPKHLSRRRAGLAPPSSLTGDGTPGFDDANPGSTKSELTAEKLGAGRCLPLGSRRGGREKNDGRGGKPKTLESAAVHPTRFVSPPPAVKRIKSKIKQAERGRIHGRPPRTPPIPSETCKLFLVSLVAFHQHSLDTRAE
ncbi:hypothetical protein BCR35DRAFT_1813 [Leucosporidium creatinivorum]|uniref:Uncharacterized protein n=1 Tax=Leucosporidium creatinivorum TaxID=106004 RepID=A0A1Y2G3G1_9BASI|nr:hypothetical protein BCR35DRAFT_1813 [Leucosporidium creatinivorum]